MGKVGEAHMKDEKDFENEFEQLMGHVKEKKGKCPEGTVLLDFKANNLSGAEQQELMDHISMCGKCQLLLHRMDGDLEEADRAAALQKWPDTDQRISDGISGVIRKPKAPVTSFRKWSPSKFSTLAYAAAIFFMLLSPFLIYRMIRLQDELASQKAISNDLNSKFQAAVQASKSKDDQIAELKQRGSGVQVFGNPLSQILNLAALRSAPEEIKPIKIPKDAQLLNLVIRLDDKKEYPLYRMDIEDSSGKKMATANNLKKDPYASLQMAIAASSLEAKDYVIKIYGMQDSKEELISAQKIQIVF
jgi:hypothetical protein